MPYLDAVIRESLRLCAPAPSTVREAVQDVVIPLGEPIVDKYGKTISSVTVGKGTTLFVRESRCPSTTRTTDTQPS